MERGVTLVIANESEAIQGNGKDSGLLRRKRSAMTAQYVSLDFQPRPIMAADRKPMH